MLHVSNKIFLQINMCTAASGLKEFINNSFQGKEPWQIVTITSTTVLTSVWLWNFVFQDESMSHL